MANQAFGKAKGLLDKIRGRGLITLTFNYYIFKQMDFSQKATKEAIERAVKALKENGIDAVFVQTKEEAKQKVLSLIPEGSEVMGMTSVTADELGITEAILNSDKYHAVKKKLALMDRETDGREMQRIGAAPEYSVGSVHAVTEDGKVLVASMSGSQLPGYAYGSDKVIWVVGAQKIVKDLDMGMKRLYEHTLPLESERAKAAYGVPGSSVHKLLIFNKEFPGRISMVIVNEAVGY